MAWPQKSGKCLSGPSPGARSPSWLLLGSTLGCMQEVRSISELSHPARSQPCQMSTRCRAPVSVLDFRWQVHTLRHPVYGRKHRHVVSYDCVPVHFFFCFWKLRLQVVMLRVTVVSASGGHTDCFVSVLSSRLLLDWFWKPVRLPTFS